MTIDDCEQIPAYTEKNRIHNWRDIGKKRVYDRYICSKVYRYFIYIPWIFVSDVCLMNWIRLISTIPMNENIIMAIIEPSITMNQVCVRISSAMLWFIGCLGSLRSAQISVVYSVHLQWMRNRERRGRKKQKQKPFTIFFPYMDSASPSSYLFIVCV